MNNDNLLKGKSTRFQSGEEAARNGRKGGLKLGANNEKRRLFREYIESELDKPFYINSTSVTKKEAICIKLVRLMLADKINNRDFLRAFEFVRDTIGEKPPEKFSFSEVDPEIVEEVERLVLEYDNTTK